MIEEATLVYCVWCHKTHAALPGEKSCGVQGTWIVESTGLKWTGGTVAGVRKEISTAWTAFEESTVPGNWRKDNPGEYNKIKAYYEDDTKPEPTGITTNFGKGLLAVVNAGKYGHGTYPE